LDLVPRGGFVVSKSVGKHLRPPIATPAAESRLNISADAAIEPRRRLRLGWRASTLRGLEGLPRSARSGRRSRESGRRPIRWPRAANPRIRHPTRPATDPGSHSAADPALDIATCGREFEHRILVALNLARLCGVWPRVNGRRLPLRPAPASQPDRRPSENGESQREKSISSSFTPSRDGLRRQSRRMTSPTTQAGFRLEHESYPGRPSCLEPSRFRQAGGPCGVSNLHGEGDGEPTLRASRGGQSYGGRRPSSTTVRYRRPRPTRTRRGALGPRAAAAGSGFRLRRRERGSLWPPIDGVPIEINPRYLRGGSGGWLDRRTVRTEAITAAHRPPSRRTSSRA